MLPDGFVYLDEEIPSALWDAKYAGNDNFIGRPVEGYNVNRVVLSREACEALKGVAKSLEMQGFRLMLFDAYRPARAVQDFCRWAMDEGDQSRKQIHYPNVDKCRLFKEGYIAEKSSHSRGSAIDLTLCGIYGNPLDMGGIFDFMDVISHHDCPNISPEQTQNRETLRKAMLAGGFKDYKNEWWHYILKDEPYPDRYFDFVIE